MSDIIFISNTGIGDERVYINASLTEENVIISPYVAPAGSALFGQNSNSYMALAPSSDWAFGTDAFTWEWWQYQVSGTLSGRSQFPRIFETSAYPAVEMGVTIEGAPNTMYIWVGSAFDMSRTLSGQVGKWTHYAVTRTGSSLRLFQDGVQQGVTVTNNENITNTQWLFIGRDSGSTYANVTQFPGYITNLHLVKGACKYTSSFTASTSPITAISGSTVLLLNMTSQDTFAQDSSGYNKQVFTGSSVVWSSNNPF